MLGEWHHGFFAMSFVGALNVGSIKLHFDDVLKSNIKTPVEPYFNDRNYELLMSSQDDDLNINSVKIPKRIEEETYSTDGHLLKYMNEFDVKDMP